MKLYRIPKGRERRDTVQESSPGPQKMGNRSGASAKHRQVGPQGEDTGQRGVEEMAYVVGRSVTLNK